MASKKAVAMKKGREMAMPAPASPPSSAIRKIKASSAKSSRKTTAPAVDDQNGYGGFILSVKRPSRFGAVSSITKVGDSGDDHEEATISRKKTK